ncbi:MAG: hypothetical protein ACK5LZ_05735 [Anaerorhabdus sp.]
MYKNGGISTIFLIYFISVISWVGMMEYQLQKQLQVFIYMKQASNELGIDIQLLDAVACDYANNRIGRGDKSYEVEHERDGEYEVHYLNKAMIIEFNEESKRIIDYRILP